jgi:hypothetical protein
MDEIEIPADLSSLSVSELQALLDQINEAGQTTASAAKEAEGDERKELVSTLQQLQEAKTKVTEALAVAEEAEAAEQAAIESAAAEFGDPEDTEAGEEAEEADEDTEEGAEAGDTEADATEEASTPEAIAASATLRVPKRSKLRRRVPEGREVKEKLVNPFATGDGGQVESLSQLGDLFKRAHTAADRNGDGMARVATFKRIANPDPARTVHERGDVYANTAIMAAAQPTDDFIVAAGGFCGPGEVLTMIEECGRTDTPVADLLGSFQARGAYQYSRQIGLDEVDQGITYWTEDRDINVDPDDVATWKPCYSLECQEFVTAVPVGIPLCFQYGTFQQWSFPEQIAAALARFDVALARRSEALVLQRIHEQSNQYTYVPPVGAGVQDGLTRLISQLLQLAGYNGRNSLDGYVLVVPEALILQLVTDARLKAWVGPTITKAAVMAGLEDTFGIRVVEAADVRVNAPAPVPALPPATQPDGGALPCPNTRLEVQLFKPSNFKHGVDNVDITVQTDIATARQNNKSVFLETIETTEKLGCDPAFSVLYDGLAVTGAQTDLVAVDDTYCPGPQPNPYGTAPVGFPGGAIGA